MALKVWSGLNILSSGKIFKGVNARVGNRVAFLLIRLHDLDEILRKNVIFKLNGRFPTVSYALAPAGARLRHFGL